ncbi:MAG: radical SAM protein [Bacteroidales bacterium]|jgi:MoaA/NifB/PqqE/SkfB family radical SAM enzyme|nr:radical SAM protein [Bacteroidales bacterium]
MYLYEVIEKELADYPPGCFAERFRIKDVKVDITNKCNLHCAHCYNNSSAQKKDFLSLPRVKSLIDDAVSFGHKIMFFNGGEAFLHKDLYVMLEYALSRKLSIEIVTNAFWAKTEKMAVDFVNHFKPLIGAEQFFNLVVSCDRFHQAQEAAPLQNLVNLAAALMHYGSPRFRFIVHKMDNIEDTTYAELLNLIQEQSLGFESKFINYQECRLRYSTGRGRLLSSHLKESPYANIPFEFSSRKPAKRIHINAIGDVFLNDGFLSSNICSFGNICRDSLSDVENNLNSNRLLRLFHFHPLKYFFYPWRKYVDLEKFCIEFSDDKIRNGFYVMELILGLLQRTTKQFDRLAKLTEARRIYVKQFNVDQMATYLAIIEHYGDLLDIPKLRNLLERSKTQAVRAKIQVLLNTTYSYNFNTIGQYGCKK